MSVNLYKKILSCMAILSCFGVSTICSLAMNPKEDKVEIIQGSYKNNEQPYEHLDEVLNLLRIDENDTTLCWFNDSKGKECIKWALYNNAKYDYSDLVPENDVSKYKKEELIPLTTKYKILMTEKKDFYNRAGEPYFIHPSGIVTDAAGNPLCIANCNGTQRGLKIKLFTSKYAKNRQCKLFVIPKELIPKTDKPFLLTKIKDVDQHNLYIWAVRSPIYGLLSSINRSLFNTIKLFYVPSKEFYHIYLANAFKKEEEVDWLGISLHESDKSKPGKPLWIYYLWASDKKEGKLVSRLQTRYCELYGFRYNYSERKFKLYLNENIKLPSLSIGKDGTESLEQAILD